MLCAPGALSADMARSMPDCGVFQACTASRAALRTVASSNAKVSEVALLSGSPMPTATWRRAPPVSSRTTTTGQDAWMAAYRLTDPSSSAVNAPAPRDPTTSISAPEPLPELSTGRLLTMTWLEGRGLMDFTESDQETRNRIARLLFEAWWGPMIHLGVIHGDPHLGNYTIRPDGSVNLLDYGCVRIFGATFVQGVIDLYRALAHDDPELAVHAFETWGFEKLSKEYVDAIHAYIEQHPETVDGIDLGLAQIDPSPKWTAIQSTRTVAVRRRTLDLAQSTYLVARAETDLQGQGFVRGLSPGTYWISTLDVPPTVGDARPQWDVPVVVRAGQTEYVTLSNSNSVRLQASQ